MLRLRMNQTVSAFAVALLAACWTFASASGAQAETRRAFVLGIERYSDPDIQSLTRSDTDAADIASDLEDLGFDKKDITLATDIRAKDEFEKRFQAFLKTIEEGDDVFFFFSGHGTSVETTNTNYLLLGNAKSLKSYTQSQLIKSDRRDDIIALKMASYEAAYETDEITKNGVSVSDVIRQIAQKQPNVAFIVLDACRSLPPSVTDIRMLKRGPSSGSRLLPDSNLPDGFLVLYSASFGETAIESFGPEDKRRNSLFTEVLRQEMQRPGQTLPQLA